MGRDGDFNGMATRDPWAGHVGRRFGDQGLRGLKGPLQLVWLKITAQPVESALGLALLVVLPATDWSRGRVDGQLQTARCVLVVVWCSLALGDGSQSSATNAHWVKAVLIVRT